MSKSHSRFNRGRPAVSRQAEIRRILRPFYEEGYSASYTAEKTGFDVKTVCRYYNEWSERLEEAEINDFMERQKRDRTQIIISSDHDIAEMTKLLDEVNAEIEKFQKEKRPIPRHLYPLKLDIIKSRSWLREKKGAFMMQPTMEEAIEKKIQEKIREHDKSRAGNQE